MGIDLPASGQCRYDSVHLWQKTSGARQALLAAVLGFGILICACMSAEESEASIERLIIQRKHACQLAADS